MHKIKFFWVNGRQFGISRISWAGFRWIETPNWKLGGTIYFGFWKFIW